MALKIFSTSFLNISNQYLVRLDVNYRYFFDKLDAKIWRNSSIALKDIMSPIISEKLAKGELEDDELLVELSNINRRANTLSDVKSVSEIGSDKVVLSNGDIIIPKIQPQMCNIFTNLTHERFIASTELVEYKCSSEINPKFLFYLLAMSKFRKCLSYTESGKTHRRVNPSELLKYKIPLFNVDFQNHVINRIERVEHIINALKSSIKPKQDIINDVFAREFKFDMKEICQIDKRKYIIIPTQEIDIRNTNLRNSSRWHKLQLIEKVIFRNIETYDYLKNFLVDVGTKNGWSPECSEFEDTTMVLGLDAINKDGVLTYDNPKYTNQTKKNINDFIIKDNDFFISRGNTVDLVALASIAMNVEDNEYIYPDLMIRITFDTTKLDKEYLAYVFNSVIGRMYFKYAAKGKQQTMVKVSSEEIKQFLIPTPDIDEQIRIVAEIKLEIDKQNEVQAKLEKLRAEIDDIIDSAIAETK